jgi:hypothetical protein
LLPATPNGPVGSTALGADGSMAAFVPATRALSWQLTDAAGEAIVRERYWLTFQPGEIRVCASCHGTNSSDQASQPEPSNTPQALVDLLRHWQASTGPVLPAVAAGSVGGAAAPENVLTINGSHGGFGRRVDLLPGQPSLLQINSPAAGPASSLFALWAYIGVPTPADQLLTFAGTLMFPLPQMMPGNPLLLTVSNSLFADPGAMLPAAATPWVLPLPGLPPQFTVTMQGAVYDSSSPFALSITNALILRVP